MAMSNEEFAEILDDESKRISGDIAWKHDPAHPPAAYFWKDVERDGGQSLRLKGTYNPLANKLSFALIAKGSGRVYALDLGTDHRDRITRELVGRKHKHRWTEARKDEETYVPGDIVSEANDPVAVWKEFCSEAKITHEGVMHGPKIQLTTFP